VAKKDKKRDCPINFFNITDKKDNDVKGNKYIPFQLLNFFSDPLDKYVVWSKDGEGLPIIEYKLSSDTPCISGAETAFK
jgi:hypothetical protein